LLDTKQHVRPKTITGMSSGDDAIQLDMHALRCNTDARNMISSSFQGASGTSNFLKGTVFVQCAQ
jgi:hypothetical protein